MILPIYLYGNPVLKQESEEIDKDYPNLSELIENMFETCKNAGGIGLAANQIGLAIQLFVVDLSSYGDGKKVFINSNIIEESESTASVIEGCLSFPKVEVSVSRPKVITVEYCDENFEKHTEEYSDLFARVILHEHEHTEGVNFIDHANAIRRRMLKSKLNTLVKGDLSASYPVRYANR